MDKQLFKLFRDLTVIAASIILAIALSQNQILEKILTATKELEIIGSFLAGIFFTSIFTTAPAIVVLGELAQANSIFLVAIIGGLGALIGDYIIFRFVKNNLLNDIIYLSQQTRPKRLTSMFHPKIFRWLTIFLGAFIIASPLPDELGLTLLGLSKIKTSLFIPISFVFNSIGILIIGLIARSIS